MPGAIIIAVIVFSLVPVWNESSNGMEFTSIEIRGGIAVKATGVIEVGDAAKFQRVSLEATIDEKGLRRIVLETPAGTSLRRCVSRR